MSDLPSDVPTDERTGLQHAAGSSSKKQLGLIAARILQLKRRLRPTRPLIIEFCGSPKSGKSSAITSLGTFLKRNGFRVRVVKEYAADSPIDDKANWLFNVWTACSTIRHIAAYVARPASDADVVLLDRGIFDALCWLRWLSATNRIDDVTRSGIANFLLLERFRSAIDLVFIFTVSPDVSIQREHAHLLTSRYGTIMNPPVLEEYLNAVRHTMDAHGSEFKRILEVDTTSSHQTDTGRDVTLRVLNVLLDSVMERIAAFPKRGLQDAFGGHSVVPLGTLEAARLEVAFEMRPLVEEGSGLVQPVVVAVLTNRSRDEVAVFSKASQSLGQESPEAGRQLLYLGGHVRQDDSFARSFDDLRGIFASTLARELGEELGVSLPVTREEPFCIWDHDGPLRSRRHVAIVFVCEVDFKVFEPKLDRWEYGAEGLEERFRAVPVDEVNRDTIEAWGMTILDRVFGRGSQQVLPFADPHLP